MTDENLNQEVLQQESIDTAQTEVTEPAQPTLEQLETLKKQLEEAKAREVGQMRKVSELSKEKLSLQGSLETLSEQISLVNRRMDLIGHKPDDYGNSVDYDQQLAALKAEEAKISQKRQLQAAYNNVQTEIQEILTDGDIDLNSEEARNILDQFNDARVKMSDPPVAVKEARKLIVNKLKTSKVDTEKLKAEITEQVRKELLEGKKTSPSLKVDTLGATKTTGVFDDIETRYAKGEVSYDEYYKARSQRGL